MKTYISDQRWCVRGGAHNGRPYNRSSVDGMSRRIGHKS